MTESLKELPPVPPDDEGSTVTEYAIIGALCSIVAIPIWGLIGYRVTNFLFGPVVVAFDVAAGSI